MHVTRDFEDLFGYFAAEGVRFVIVGGHAVAFHAKPRYTKDVDVFVEASAANAESILRALDAFGFGGLGLTVTDFTTPDQIIQLGIAPNRVDILTSLGGVSFADAYANSVQGAYGQQTVRYIGKAELIEAKRAAGRPQDLADLAWLEAEDADSLQEDG